MASFDDVQINQPPVQIQAIYTDLLDLSGLTEEDYNLLLELAESAQDLAPQLHADFSTRLLANPKAADYFRANSETTTAAVQE